jgi:hypothetical protein
MPRANRNRIRMGTAIAAIARDGGCLCGGRNGADFHADAAREDEPIGLGGEIEGEHGGISRLEIQPRYVKV